MPCGRIPTSKGVLVRSWPSMRTRPSRSLVRALAGAAILLLTLPAFIAQAFAHGAKWESRCQIFVGPDVMNLASYSPDASRSEFCVDIPSTGHAIIALDAEQDELRDMAIEIRIVKDTGREEKENIDAVTVAYKPPQVYPTGTINFEHVFPDAGYFVGIVTVTGDHGEHWVSRFPFSVGMTFMRLLPVYVLQIVGVALAVFLYLRRRPIAMKRNQT